MRIVICIDTDLSRSKTLCGKFSSRISSRRSSRIFCPTHHPLSCLALGFSARCGAGFSPALHRASHPAHGPMLPGPVPTRARVALSVSNGFACSSLPGPAFRRAQVAHTIHPVSECLLEFASAGSLPCVPGP